MIVLDVIWFIVMSSVWGQTIENPFWKGQSGLRKFGLILCWVQIGFKSFTVFYLFINFKGKYPNEIAYLHNFDYSQAPQQKGKATPGQDDDWGKNPYEDN